MPVRALRLKSNVLADSLAAGLKTMNAREGIKTGHDFFISPAATVKNNECP